MKDDITAPLRMSEEFYETEDSIAGPPSSVPKQQEESDDDGRRGAVVSTVTRRFDVCKRGFRVGWLSDREGSGRWLHVY